MTHRRRWPLFAIAWTMAGVIHLVPLFLVRNLPLCDLPEHLAQAAIRLRHDDPRAGFGDYVVSSSIRPYVLHPILCGLALRVTPDAPAASRLVAGLTLLALPLALLALLVVTGRDPWFSLIGFPLSYNAAFFWGFHAWLLGLALSLLALATTLSPAFARRRGPILLVGSLLLFLAHPIAYALFLSIHVVLVLHDRTAWKRLGFLLPSLALFALWSFPSFLGSDVRYGNWARTGWGAHFLPWTALPARLVQDLIDVDVRAWDELLLLGLACVAILSRQRAAGAGPRLPHTAPLRSTALVTLLLWVALPSAVRGHFYVGQRWLLPASVLGLTAIASAAAPAWARWALVLGCVASATLRAETFQALDREHPGFETVARGVPPGSRWAYLPYDPASRRLKMPQAYVHFGAYVQADQGGVLPGTFETIGVSYRAGSPGALAPADIRAVPARFDPLRDLPGFDWFLLLDPHRESPLHGGAGVRPVATEGDWSLLRRT
jgi:hypothetical protein